jgi:hypothetical protein
MEATRLRQDDIYQVMLIQDPSLGEKIARMAQKMGVGVDMTSKDEAEAAHGGVRMLGSASQLAKNEHKEWSDMGIGGLDEEAGVGKLFRKMEGNIGSSMSKLINSQSYTKAKTLSQMDAEEAAAKPQTGVALDVGRHLQPTHRPPPGHEAGISNVTQGHRPNLGLPDLPPLKLPTAKGSGDELATGGAAPLNITHKFEPIQIDITGLGDKKLTTFVQAQLAKQDTENKLRAGGGT